MDTNIDWYSFTLPLPGARKRILSWVHINASILKHDEQLFAWLGLEKTDWHVSNGRPPFAASARRGGIVVYWGKPDLLLIEITGEGCDALRQRECLDYVIGRTKEATTRIDIAVDLRTAINPQEFVSKKTGKKHRAKSIIMSETGVTYYVGSRKSNRFSRCYRYSPPHPRSDKLRVEMVSRKDDAKLIAAQYITDGLQAVLSYLTSVYGWEHPLWQIEAAKGNQKAYRADRKQSNTVRWLIVQAGPAFRKLVNDGSIENPREFLDKYFMV